MTEGFGKRSFAGLLENPLERRNRRLKKLFVHFKTETKRAFKDPSFADRKKTSDDVVSLEAVESLRHFSGNIKGPGPWKKPSYWDKTAIIMSRAVTSTSRKFEPAFIDGGKPDTSEAGKQIFNDAVKNGPNVPNRVAGMELLALSQGDYRDDLGTNPERREHISELMDKELDGIGIFALSEMVIKELKAAGEYNLPNVRDLRKLEDTVIYDTVLGLTDPEKDFYRPIILEGKKLTFDREAKKRTPEQEFFVHAAVAIPHMTWEGEQAHVGFYKNDPERVDPDARLRNFRPLPIYIRDEYALLIGNGVSSQDAVLRIAYELFKDLWNMRQQDEPDVEKRVRIPDASEFMSPSTAKEEVRHHGKVAAAAFMAGMGAVPSATEHDIQVPAPAASQQAEAPVRLAIETEVVKAESGIGPILLIDELLQDIEAKPNHLAEFNDLYPPEQGETRRERAHRLAEHFNLWDPGEWEAVIGAGDQLKFRLGDGVFLANANDRDHEVRLTNPDGTPRPFYGATKPDR